MANNVLEHGNLFEKDIKMWVFEEVVNNRKLTELINEKHENVKYLPGYKMPNNVRAVPDLMETVQEATILVFVVPHQVRHTYTYIHTNTYTRTYIFAYSGITKHTNTH